jgi:hypothetical protein
MDEHMEHLLASSKIGDLHYGGLWYQDEDGVWQNHAVFPLTHDHWALAQAVGFFTYEELLAAVAPFQDDPFEGRF